MELSLIEYLESKHLDVDQIIRFQKRFLNKDDEKIIKKLESTYKIFGYADLNELEINQLISNNILLFKKTDFEIIKAAYTWSRTGVLYDAVDKKNGINYNNPLKVYLRNEYLNSGINYNKSPISYRALTMGEEEFQNDYRGPIKENGKTFYPTFENLIYIYGKGQTIEEKQKYLEQLLEYSSTLWYLRCLKKEKELKKDKEDQGYGSI